MTQKEKLFYVMEQYKEAMLEKKYSKAVIIALDLATMAKELRDN